MPSVPQGLIETNIALGHNDFCVTVQPHIYAYY